MALDGNTTYIFSFYQQIIGGKTRKVAGDITSRLHFLTTLMIQKPFYLKLKKSIVYGAQKFHQFIYGRPTQVESDHKQYILNSPLHQAPLRLQKMMLTLQRYDLKVKYLPGSELSVADALSRSYLQETSKILIPDLEVNEVQLTVHLSITPEKYAEFQKDTADDQVMQALSTVVLDGWPGNKEELPGSVRE